MLREEKKSFELNVTTEGKIEGSGKEPHAALPSSQKLIAGRNINTVLSFCM